ncbi:MAG: nitrile hydratase subunit alpha [Rhodospirillales bacterium]
MAHDHSHDNPHGPHPYQPDHEPPSEVALRGLALNELLIEKGIYSADDMRRKIEQIEQVTPETHGARVVARAWVDPAFKARLMDNASGAVKDLGLDPGYAELTVLENTPGLHNVVVCTLCSCYPRWLLGRPPAWYKSFEYRARVVREPRAVLAEFGLDIAADVEVRVHDSTAELRYLVLPMRPEGTDGWSEDRLAAIVTRDCMIGTAVPQV